MINLTSTFLTLSQLIISISVLYVWIFRYPVIIKEFNQFGLSDLVRSFVGASKVALATLLVSGIWYHSLVPMSATLMGLFMLSAQYYHFKIRNSFMKHLPSLILLMLCLFITLVSI